MWYAVGVALRNMLYSCGIKKSDSPNIPTVCIGNLRMGGTGKTPHTEYLVRLFSDRRTALLSRGYGRKSTGFVIAEEESTPAQVGDEPLMLKRRFPSLTVAVCEDRAEGIRRLAQLPEPPELVLLDDAYQHRKVKSTATILLTEYSDPFSDDHILPFGNLREFRSGSNRADIVVVTKCPPAISLRKREKYRRQLHLQSSQQLFFSQISYLPPQPLFEGQEWQPVKDVLLVTGIAHPAPLKHHLEKHCTVRHLDFPDHHNFTAADCQKITKAFNAMKEASKAVVITEKDAMRLLSPTIKEMLQELPIFYIPIEVQFHDQEGFDRIVNQKVSPLLDATA